MISNLSDLFNEATQIGLLSAECLVGVTHTSGMHDYKLLFFHIALVNKPPTNSLKAVDRCTVGNGKSANIFSASLDFQSIQGMINSLSATSLTLPFSATGKNVIEHGLDVSTAKPISYLAADSRLDAALSFLPFPGVGLTIFELFDMTKKALTGVSAEDIEEIDKMILTHSDFSLAHQSARVGNLILIASLDPYELDFKGDTKGNGIRVKLSPLRPGLNFSDFVLTATTEFNGEMTSTAAISPIQNVVRLKNFDSRGLIDLKLWNIRTKKLEARNFGRIIHDVGINISTISHSRSAFIRSPDGNFIHQDTIGTQVPMSSNRSNRNLQWSDQVRNQIQLAEKKALIAEKKVIQFNDGSHLNALLEIVSAINSIGICEELKIWDPYIGDYYLDFLTLLKNVSRIKVISSLDEAMKDVRNKGFGRLVNAAELGLLDYEKKCPKYFIEKIQARRAKRRLLIEENRDTKIKQYLDELRRTGLKLDFRYRKGNHSLAFHDRFIIGGGRCWSVGSSLNSIGNSHSLMLEVPYPEIVEREFDSLWEDFKENQF